MAQAKMAAMDAVAAPRLTGTWLAEWARKFKRDLFDPYRPELHYMRGPGPKWHAKHGPQPYRTQAT